MAKITLEKDFKEFLRLLNSNGVEYLLIGGYAVGIHGYVKTTNDLDIWVNVHPENATRIDRALLESGFASASLTPELFLSPNIIRMGVPPNRIEILTSISGVEFDSCYAEKEIIHIDEMAVPVISLARFFNPAAQLRTTVNGITWSMADWAMNWNLRQLASRPYCATSRLTPSTHRTAACFEAGSSPPSASSITAAVSDRSSARDLPIIQQVSAEPAAMDAVQPRT